MVHTPGVADLETEFQRLARVPLAVLWTMAATGEISEVSDSVEQLRGITPAQALTQSVDEIHPPQSLRVSLTYFERFARALNHGEIPEPFHADLEYLCQDGSAVWCEVLATPVIGPAGDVVGLRGVSAPIADPGRPRLHAMPG